MKQLQTREEFEILRNNKVILLFFNFDTVANEHKREYLEEHGGAAPLAFYLVLPPKPTDEYIKEWYDLGNGYYMHNYDRGFGEITNIYRIVK